MTRRPAKRPIASGLHLRLVNGETIHLNRFEAVPLLLHRYLLAVYLFMWMALTLTDPSGQSHKAPLDLRLLQYGVGMFVVFATFLAIYGACDVVSGIRGRGVRLYHWLVVLVVAILGLAASSFCIFLITGENLFTPKIFFILSIFYFVIIEVTVQLIVWLLLPRILAEIRRDPEATVAGEAATVGKLVTGGHVLAHDTLLHIEAQGNYVAIITDTGMIEAPGPFSALVEQLPPHIGLRVHRSHWVARRAVLHHRRSGRDLVLDLSYGGVAKVALPRQAEVIDWLAQTDPAQDQPIPASDATQP